MKLALESVVVKLDCCGGFLRSVICLFRTIRL